VELDASFPPHFKLHGLRTKHILKRALGVPVIPLNEYQGCDGVRLAASLSDQLAGIG
jgi:hypothetical protein